MKKNKINERREAKRRLNAYMNNKKEYGIIHYTCQSFYDDLCGKSPRIVAICILLPFYGQTATFSIPSIAEEKGIELSSATDAQLDILEADMLRQYYDYLSAHTYIEKWIHWNMRDNNFGFQAIDHRFTVLTKCAPPVQISDEHKLDLAWLIKGLYGPNYAKDPKLVNLLTLNDIHPKNLLSGADEAKAFADRHYLSMVRSAHAKVGCFATLIERAIDNDLKTDSHVFRDVYGLTLSGMISYVKDNAALAFISMVIGTLLLNFLSNIVWGKWLARLFNLS